MEHIDLFWDACFLVLGIIGAIFVIIKRKRFDLWSGLLTCAAWILNAVRRLCYDWVLITLDTLLNTGKENDIFLFMQDSSIVLRGIDTLVFLLLIAALIRFALIELFWRWYSKAQKALG